MDIKENKFYCEKCNYGCNIISRWEKHINTVLHITGKKKIRSDSKEINNCEYCDFQRKNIHQFKEYQLNYHSTKEEREKSKYYCKDCYQIFFSPNYFNKHNIGKKHHNQVKVNQLTT